MKHKLSWQFTMQSSQTKFWPKLTALKCSESHQQPPPNIASLCTCAVKAKWCYIIIAPSHSIDVAPVQFIRATEMQDTLIQQCRVSPTTPAERLTSGITQQHIRSHGKVTKQTRVVLSVRKMRWTKHVTRKDEEKNAYRIWSKRS